MQFCSIHEAWGNDAYISENFSLQNQKNINKKFKEKTIEKFKPLITDLDLISKKKSLNTCDNIIEHILNCPYCSKKIKNKLYSNFYNIIRNSIEEYKEPIILILITIFIILLINLIIKMD
ncbi:hypothetical protein crov167 [Cafeteria roenbergensis virus]|uniref:Uncharacterized protein n=1 Tax=Cafeteria roenbergensis virus (strain BV-PW1) TaxID=693272 RepID=E3T4T7_CROVB|nr:hypothetical protein crov167 [Cafeteria roenbergensis virus BV-PW1]ADO67200.1 hypothetical protein crov167 [Cafeteria roenbergensis virus BV-PW1]